MPKKPKKQLERVFPMKKKPLSKWKLQQQRRRLFKLAKAGLIDEKTYFDKIQDIKKNSELVYKGQSV